MGSDCHHPQAHPAISAPFPADLKFELQLDLSQPEPHIVVFPRGHCDSEVVAYLRYRLGKAYNHRIRHPASCGYPPPVTRS